MSLSTQVIEKLWLTGLSTGKMYNQMIMSFFLTNIQVRDEQQAGEGSTLRSTSYLEGIWFSAWYFAKVHWNHRNDMMEMKFWHWPNRDILWNSQVVTLFPAWNTQIWYFFICVASHPGWRFVAHYTDTCCIRRVVNIINKLVHSLGEEKEGVQCGNTEWQCHA